jgi:hypothetical protein
MMQLPRCQVKTYHHGDHVVTKVSSENLTSHYGDHVVTLVPTK